MNRRSPEQIAEIISTGLRRIEEQLSTNDSRLEIRVPPGAVRSVQAIRSDYRCVSDQMLKRNICYAVEALDLYRWIINRFKVYGPVASYLFKTGIVLVNMIIEALVHDFLTQKGIQPAKKHSKNIPKLQNQCSVPDSLCERIDKLREQRANIHLFLVTDLETEKYTLRDWNKAITLLRDVRNYFGRSI